MFCFNYQTFATMAITVKIRIKDSEANSFILIIEPLNVENVHLSQHYIVFT